MKNGLEVRYLDESEFDNWRQLVSEGVGGSVYSLPEYLDILCAATGGRYRVLGVTRGDELRGGVALYEEDGPAGRLVANRLLLYYNGIVLRNYDTKYPSERTSRHLAVLGALKEFLDTTNYPRIILHNWQLRDMRPFVSEGWRLRPAYTYVVDISDCDATFGRIEQNLRRLINRCEKSGATVIESDDFDSFFRLHNEIHERKGAPLYLPKDAFGQYFRQLQAAGLGRLFLVRLGSGEIAAGQLVLTPPLPMSYTVCAGADGEYQKLGTTPFLRYKAFEKLSAAGYKFNDLTDAALNPVTRFKSQLGGDLIMNLVAQSDRPAFAKWQAKQRSQHGIKDRLGGLARKVLGRK